MHERATGALKIFSIVGVVADMQLEVLEILVDVFLLGGGMILVKPLHKQNTMYELRPT